MIQAIIFDCFGVIRVDTTEAAYRKLGGDFARDREYIVRAIEAANAGQIPSSGPAIAERLGVSEAAWRNACTEASTLDQAVLDYALELRRHYKVGMLSNMGTGGLERWFEPGVLAQYFDAAICSGDIGFAKPEARAYEVMADRLGVRVEACVMIDDRENYCEGARAVGMAAIFYQSLPQLKRELAPLLAETGDR